MSLFASFTRFSAQIVAVSLVAFLLSPVAFAQSPSPTVGAPPEDFEQSDHGSFQQQRDDWFYGQRAYPRTQIPAGARLRALKQMDKMLASEAAARAKSGSRNNLPTGNWQVLGPQPLNGFWGVNAGRVTALAVDPTNSNIVYLGAALGGIWKTTNGGTTWTPMTDQQASLATGSIAIDPQNHNTIYVGTGEANNAIDSYYGAGILKSTDGGTTWTNYPGPFAGGTNGGARIGGIAVQPTNSSIVLAAVGCCSPSFNSGVFRSTDAGMTWIQVLNVNSNQAYNVIFDTVTPNTVYASVDGNGVYKSTDGGQTWVARNGTGSNTLPTSGTGRVALAMDPNVTTTLYVGINNSATSALQGFYKTTDGGANWTQLVNVPDYCNGQCWYDNAIAVAPGNSNVLFVGGDNATPIIRSIDGGSTWTIITAVHPDSHAFAFSSDGKKLYNGDDGGIWSTTDITNATMTWTSLNQGLATIQYYPGPAIDPTNANNGYGGTQDNSTEHYTGTTAWTSVFCGDGGRNLFDFTTPSTIYVNCISLSLYKSTDSGVTFNPVTNGINFADLVMWVPPVAMDPGNSQRLYFGTQFIYQSTNGATSWTPISPDLTLGGNALSSIAVSPVDSNTVYVASGDARLHVSKNALSGTSATWTDITQTNLPNRFITAVVPDPHSASIAYAIYSGFDGGGDANGHIFMTANTGATWTDITNNLPDVPANGLVVDPDQAGVLYVATDIGVFYTTTSGSGWNTLVTGLPRVAVVDLAFQHQTHTLWAATHGRSMWGINTANVLNIFAVTSISPTSATAGGATFTLTVNGVAFDSTCKAQWNGANLTTTFVNTGVLTATVPANDIATAGTSQVTVFCTSTSQTSGSFAFQVNNPVPAATSLSPATASMGGTAFTLSVTGSSFVNGATVQWNGSARTTSFVSSTQLNATINAADITNSGTASVTVNNPTPGGGVSNALTFTINNIIPTLTSLAPTSQTAGGVTFTLTVNGTGFVTGAIANWNGAALATTFKSSSKLTATVPAVDIANAGTFPVTATNPAPGGGTSASQTFTVNNPRPTITTLAPTSKTAGGAAFTLSVTGTNFVSTSVVNWAGTARTTSFVSKTKLNATINAADIALAGTFKVTVTNPTPGGGTSGSSDFTVNNAVPTLASISPTSASTGSAAFTLTTTGTNYVAGSKIQWNGTNLATTVVSATSLTATVPASDIASAGTASVTVNNPTPGGGTSATKTFNINNAVPTITSLNPASATAGGAQLTVTVNGTGFVTNSTVNWNGAGRATTYTSSTKLTATITAADIALAGTANITATNPAPGGGTSANSTFTINNPKPTITSASPANTTAGGAAFTLTLTGTNYVKTSAVQWNGSARTTTYVSATQIKATITAADIATGSTAQVTVNNPTPGGGTSPNFSYTVNNPLPVATSVSPNSVTHGGADFTVTVTGSGFVANSTVRWNGGSMTTTFVSATKLTAVVPAAKTATKGTSNVTVNNAGPGGGTSGSLTFTVN